jgi:transmembrane sensor
LVRYFAGKLSPSEFAGFEAWIAEDLAREDEIERLRRLWEASSVVSDRPDTEAALVQLKERIHARAPAHPFRLLAPPAGSLVWRIAAAIALVVGGAAVWRMTIPSAPGDARRSPVWTYATARAQRATVTLPDSSRVVLNTETRLEIPAQFGRGTRDVYLDGEAYFEITHDRARPFRVHTGAAVTEVLGTKFGVRARRAEAGVRVAVAEGRVALSDTASRVLLERGDLGHLAADGSPTVVHDVDVDRLLGWTTGHLMFERTPLPDVLAELSRWFDRDFVLGDGSLASMHLTTSLSGASVGEAIAVLEAGLDVDARVVGRTIILRKRER